MSSCLGLVHPYLGRANSLPEHRGVAQDSAYYIDPVSRNRIRTGAHRRSAKEDGQYFTRPPERDITDLNLRRGRFAVVLDPWKLKVKLLAPGIERRFDRQGGINGVCRFIVL